MYDRIPSPGKENRVSITQDNGQVITGVLAYADDATQEGSAYTKGNVLPDDVCWLMDLDFDGSEPDDAFRYLALMNATVYGGIAIRVISNGLPLSGITFSVTGTGSVTTDSQGCVFLRKPPGNYTATFTSTLDLVFSPASFQVTATAGKINSYNVEAQESTTTEKTFTSSTTVNFSDRVSGFDIFCVGGGGSGGAAVCIGRSHPNISVGIGGAGGKTATTKGVQNTGQQIQVSIGSGGTQVTASISDSTSTATGNAVSGNSGGETYVSVGGVKKCSAPGGEGGTGRYDYDQFRSAEGASGGSGSGAVGWKYSIDAGSSGSNGGDGGPSEYPYNNVTGGKGQGTTTRAFGESIGEAYSPAGGSVGAWNNVSIGSPGSGGGQGYAQIPSGTTGSAAGSQGTVEGAGGGGAAVSKSSSSSVSLTATSGAGKSGLVKIRWRYK